MAQRGPKPKPTSLRVLEGDPNKSRYNFSEPEGGPFDASAIPDRVRCNPDALHMWETLAPKLIGMGLIQDIDHYALEALCVTYGMWCLKPSVQMTSKLQSLLAEFGMTPSSRTRLHAKPAKTETPLEQLIAPRRRAK